MGRYIILQSETLRHGSNSYSLIPHFFLGGISREGAIRQDKADGLDSFALRRNVFIMPLVKK